MKKLLSILAGVFLTTSLFAQKPTLLFYCGITMVKPMLKISKIIEKKYNCKIDILQGGSADLYKSLKYAQKGDLYLPGSASYRKKHLKDGLLLDKVYVGYNQAAIFVQKGNPLHIKSLDRLLDENVATMLCDPQSGSIGKQTKKVLIAYKGKQFYEDAFDMTLEVGTDSRNINTDLRGKTVDMAVNWRATGHFDDNKKYIDIIDIDEKYAPKQKLEINLLKFSQHPKIAKAFMKYASSSKGQQIMKEYGFIK
jgi:molybdate transport system substrate-binding protein